MRTRKLLAAWRLTLVGLFVVSVLAACGSSSGIPSLSGTPGSSGSSENAVSPAVTGGSAIPDGSQAPVPVERNPPGDIPDNIAFIAYVNAAGGYSFVRPEGWAETTAGARVLFVDKLNGIAAETVGRSQAPSVADATAHEIPRLRSTQSAFEARSVDPVSLPAGSGVKIVYRRNSASDPVTGKQYRDEVEEYLITMGAKTIRLDLYGPVGADNVDAYRMITQSLRLS
ncbi:hypothetical protein FDG2_5117 [Candidatus Protofrankia californiensis]|uniref:Secreted protein n=1 Tax=Candidatus Protofrankia californiensis TaxID=1839754 RepID=A0A1C3PAZ2_9ACTN|nr:hypothetical protein FDG2_5117 [Candidatus Protofrankia californiensis]